jgi:transcriptional regulator with XRE-family HTH domain
MYRLGKMSGLSNEAISNLEQGQSDPKLSTLVKLARGLGIEPWELLREWRGEAPKTTAKRGEQL